MATLLPTDIYKVEAKSVVSAPFNVCKVCPPPRDGGHGVQGWSIVADAVQADRDFSDTNRKVPERAPPPCASVRDAGTTLASDTFAPAFRGQHLKAYTSSLSSPVSS